MRQCWLWIFSSHSVVCKVTTKAILSLWVSVCLSQGTDNDIIFLRLLKQLIRIIHARCLASCLKPGRNQKCSSPTSNPPMHIYSNKVPMAYLEDICTYVVHANLNHPTLHLDLCMWRPLNMSPGRLWRTCIPGGLTRTQSFCSFKIPAWQHGNMATSIQNFRISDLV